MGSLEYQEVFCLPPKESPPPWEVWRVWSNISISTICQNKDSLIIDASQLISKSKILSKYGRHCMSYILVFFVVNDSGESSFIFFFGASYWGLLVFFFLDFSKRTDTPFPFVFTKDMGASDSGWLTFFHLEWSCVVGGSSNCSSSSSLAPYWCNWHSWASHLVLIPYEKILHPYTTARTKEPSSYQSWRHSQHQCISSIRVHLLVILLHLTSTHLDYPIVLYGL